ncbi:reverse transcriptase domain-containing protein [Tanacetum coccineum]
MTNKYCPRNEIKKLEVEIWNLKVKGTDVIRYNQRFQELALLCDRMFPKESDKIERYVGGLPDMIHGSMVASKPKTLQKEYVGTLSLCNKCKFHYNGQYTVKCAKYKKVGHLTRDCRSPAATNNQRNPTCYECRNQGHYRSDCPELKNQNHGNQAEGTGPSEVVHALRGGETNQDLNNMEDDINV